MSPVSCWEIGLLHRDGRIVLDRPLASWVERLLADRRSSVADLSLHAAAWAGSLAGGAFPGDPADRLIYATARDLRVPLLSKDERLQRYAAAQRDVDVIW